jgi:hypothetical protein
MSDDLVTGEDTGGWGMPAGIYNYCTGEMEYGGAIWYGDEPPTKEDYEALCNLYGFRVSVDVPTLFGGPSHRDRVKDDECYQAPVVKL